MIIKGLHSSQVATGGLTTYPSFHLVVAQYMKFIGLGDNDLDLGTMLSRRVFM